MNEIKSEAGISPVLSTAGLGCRRNKEGGWGYRADNDWATIDTAPKNGEKVLARDADGEQQWTWFDFGGWCYRGWRENEDQEEFEYDERWYPTEWMAPNAGVTGLAPGKDEQNG